MSIFESLENLNVSEECFDDIINMVSEKLQDKTHANFEKAKKAMDDPEIKAMGEKTWDNLTPAEQKKYEKVAGDYHKAFRQDMKAINLRDDSYRKSYGHNPEGETKGERNQRSADYRNPRYSGENGMYIKDRRAQQDAESGYNIAINKAIRRHKGEK